MPACPTHPDTYYPPGGACILCLRGQAASKRLEEKTVKQSENTFNKKKVAIVKQQEKRKENTKLIKEILAKNPTAKVVYRKSDITKYLTDAQYQISRLAKAVYGGESKYINCWVCNKPVLLRGTTINNTSHCSHYYPKSRYWGIAHLLVNVGLCCKQCNVDEPETAPAMLPKMIEWHGKENIENLHKLATEFKFKKDTGVEHEKPDAFHLMAVIKILKQEYKRFQDDQVKFINELKKKGNEKIKKLNNIS